MVGKKVAKRKPRTRSIVGDRIKQFRNKLSWTQQRLSTEAGVDTSFISRIERGESGGTHETLQKLAGALGVSYASLLEIQGNVEIAPSDFRRIPVIDMVQAGQWRSIQEALADGDFRDFVMTNKELPASAVALSVRGDSMEPEFREGDVVIVTAGSAPRIGDFVIAVNDAGEATLKKYGEVGLDEKGRMVFELVPLNPLHPRWRSDRQAIAIMGVVVEHRKDLRRR